MTDTDLLPFLNRRVFAKVQGDPPYMDAGVLWRDHDGRRFLYRLAPSSPRALEFASSFPQFTADQIDEIELV